MDFLIPWGNFLRKSGDTMTGLLTCDSGIVSNAPITIVHDTASFTNPHVVLKGKTAAEYFFIFRAQSFDNTWRGIIGGDKFGNISNAALPGLQELFPLNTSIAPGNWNIDGTGPVLTGRRMLMLHNFIFG